jgi:uracil-DNA glycosylase family 4
MFDVLNERIVSCRLCPRLVKYRENLPPRKAFASQEYWRKPVTGFGDPQARIVIVGLAPAAHGGERTGRVFTGDESARFLYKSLYKVGLASRPTSEDREDGLILNDCYITAAVKCAPPNNKPTPSEFCNCSQYLDEELRLLRNVGCIVALGRLAFAAIIKWAQSKGGDTSSMTFAHGRVYKVHNLPNIFACYHPSPRNTYTGTLTTRMLESVLRRVITDASK